MNNKDDQKKKEIADLIKSIHKLDIVEQLNDLEYLKLVLDEKIKQSKEVLAKVKGI